MQTKLRYSGLLARLSLALLSVSYVHAVLAPSGAGLADYDIRNREAKFAANEGEAVPELARLKMQVPDIKVDFDPVTGSRQWVRSKRGFLSGPGGTGLGVPHAQVNAMAGDDSYRVAKAFLNEHAQFFGYGAEALNEGQVKRDFITPHNGLRTVVWQQEFEGIPVFDGLLIVHTTRNEELVSLSSGFLAQPAQAAEQGTPRQVPQASPLIDVKYAVALAAEQVEAVIAVSDITLIENRPETRNRRQHFRAGGLKGEAVAELVWLPLNASSLRLCWQVILTSARRGEMFKVIIDAGNGEALLRHCLTNYLSEATYRVYTSDSPSPFSPGHAEPNNAQPPMVDRKLVTLSALNPTASPAGWISDGMNETRGNNVDAHTDWTDDDVPDLPRPSGTPFRTFAFPLDLGLAPRTYSAASVVQLFYWNNWMHDKLYELGFTEASGNFQNDNFGRGGIGQDAVQADGQDGGGYNNANFATPPDGYPPRMQMYLFSGPTPDRDGDLDAEVVLHEYTHGLSNRRVGGGAGLAAVQSRGLGEGWSDFYALALLSEAGDDVNGNFPTGGYLTFGLNGLVQNYYFGIRRYPYSTDMSRNPLTFKDIDPGQAVSHAGIPRNPIVGGTANEVHNMGEVWCATLWEIRAKLVGKYGWATGNQLTLQLVTDGMNLSPPNPNFLQARDAILQADLITNGGANQNELWAGFAKRGLGVGASSPPSSTVMGVRESFALPGTVYTFAWGQIISPQLMNQPFVASLKALDGLGNEVTNYSETVTLSCVVTNAPSPVQITPAFATLVNGRWSGNITIHRSTHNAVLRAAEGERVGVSAPFDTVASNAPPTIVVQPANRTNAVGSTTRLSVYADGTPPLAYQWHFNGEQIDGATTGELLLRSVQFEQAGVYAVLVTNMFGSLMSSNALLTIVSAPPCAPVPSGVVSWWQANQSAYDHVGGNLGFLSNGVEFAESQVGHGFRFDGSNSFVDVPDAPALRLTNELTVEFWVKRQRLDYYDYVVEKGGDWTGGKLNYAVALHVAQFSHCLHFVFAGGWRGAGSIADYDWHHCAVTARHGDADPEFYIDGIRQTVTYRFGASKLNLYPSTRSLHIGAQVDPQTGWNYFSKVLLDELALYNRALPIEEIQGIYAAEMSGKCFTPSKPEIITHPAHRVAGAGEAVEFSVTATGTAPLFYQWFFNGTDLPGATKQTLLIENVGLDQAGLYSVAVTNSIGAALSSNAQLTVHLLPPVIQEHPHDQTVGLGADVSFDVKASGTPPLYYLWHFDGSPLPGETGLRLLLTNVQQSARGQYSVLVTNSSGSALSSNATLIVLAQTNCAPTPLNHVSWWRAEGNAFDTVNDNNGMLMSGTAFGQGKVGLAFEFNGSNSFVEVPDVASLRLTNQITIEFWVRRLRLDYYDYIVEKGGDWTGGKLNYGVALHVGQYNHCLHFTFAGGWRGAGSISDTNWHHCVVAAQQGAIDPVFYIDGLPQPVTYRYGASTINLYPSSQPLHIGAQVDYQTGWKYYSKALIDELSLYARNLSATEVESIYRAGSQGKCLAPTPPVVLTHPTNQIAPVGGTARFSVLVSGTPPLSYQWRFENVALAGQTGSSLAITNVQLTNSGSYSVLITNSLGSASSSNAFLTILDVTNCTPAPNGMAGWWRGENSPVDQASTNHGALIGNCNYAPARVGVGFMFDGDRDAVRIGNPPGLQLQHFTIEAWIRRASSSRVTYGAYNIGMIFAYGPGGYGLYLDPNGRPTLTKVTVSNVSVNRSITDTNLHHLAVTKSGSTVTFYIDGEAFPATSSYGPAFSFTTDASLGAWGANADSSFLGTIDELAVYSRALSPAEISEIYAAPAGKCEPAKRPEMVLQPKDQTVAIGSNVVFTALASGSTPLDYQWLKGGSPIAGATGTSLIINNAQPADSGIFQVIVTNVAGSVVSSNAVLAVMAPPVITFQPQHTNAVVGTSVHFTVAAIGSAEMAYQWRKDGIEIPGATGSTYTLLNVQADSAGSYSVLVTNLVGCVLSANAVLTVWTPPMILSEPQSQSVVLGQPALFTIAATGNPAPAFQWLKDGSAIPGATSASHMVTSAQSADAGVYSVRVTNMVGVVQSSNAFLTVIADRTNCYPSPAGLVAWWRGENDGTDVGGKHRGALSNGVSFQPGKVGIAFAFNGTNGFVEVADAPGLRLTNELTIEFWVKRNRLDYYDYVVEKGGDTTAGTQNYGVALHIGEYNHCLHFTFNDGWRGAGSIADTNWHHCAVVARNGQPDPVFYIDGIEQPVTHRFGASLIDLHPSTRPLHIGAQVDASSGWSYYSKAVIDELAFYNRTLSKVEIQSIYSAGSYGKCASSPPAIEGHPASKRVVPGCEASLEVNAIGTPTLYYQWSKDGISLTTQTEAILRLNPLQTRDFGIYRVTVSNQFGSVASGDAVLSAGHAPNPGLDTIWRYASGGARVHVNELLANDTDADGDVLRVLGISPTSAGGGSVTRTNDWIYYRPAAGVTNADIYTYILTDNLCGGIAYGAVAVQVRTDSFPAHSLKVQELPNGSHLIAFAGIPGLVYRIQCTDDLSEPHWRDLGQQTADEFGTYEFVDPPATNGAVRFYRSVSP